MHAVLHKHCVQAGEQIDSIMKGQVRAGKPYLYILAWHVTKKDIPLSHNVGQLAYTHTQTHTERAPKTGNQRSSCPRSFSIQFRVFLASGRS